MAITHFENPSDSGLSQRVLDILPGATDNPTPPAPTNELFPALEPENQHIITHADSIKVGGALVHYTLYAQEGLDLKKAPWIQLTPGYCGIPAAYQPLGYHLARLGVVATAIKAPRTLHWHGLHPKHVLHPDLLLAQAAGGVARDTAQKFEAHNIHMVGHSMGAPADINAAGYIARYKQKNLIRSVTALTPGGATGYTLAKTMSNMSTMFQHEVIPNYRLLVQQQALEGLETGQSGPPPSLAGESLEYIWRNPYRTLAEGITVGRKSCDIRPGLEKLHDLDIKTACIAGIADYLFAYQRVSGRISEYVDRFVGMDTPVTAGHMAPQLYPKETAELILRTIQEID